VHADLLAELLPGVDETERVVVGLADELAAPGLGELLEEVDDVGGELLELVEDGPRDGVADAEVAIVPADEIEDLLRGGAVALVRHLLADLPVGLLVKVEGVGVEDGVPLEAVRLVDLEVEDDRRHGDSG
jgi:hypothetical protein